MSPDVEEQSRTKHEAGNRQTIMNGQVRRRRVISGGTLRRIGGPLMPMPRVVNSGDI